MHRYAGVRAAALRLVPVLALAAAACDVWPRVETRTFRVQHLAERQLENLLGPYVYTDRDSNPGRMSVSPGAVTVRETTDNLEKIDRVLQEFDLPAPRLRLRFQLIEANGEAAAPEPRIADVVDQLRDLFRFQGYRLLGESFVAVGGGEFWQPFAGLPWSVAASWAIQTRPGVVEIAGLEVQRGDVPSQPTRVGGVTLTAGQTVVLGSAPPSSQGETVILTVRAEQVGEGGG
jgi:hypothetical protein